MLARKEKEQSSSFQVLDLRWLAKDIFVLRFEKKTLTFKAGQYLLVGPHNFPETREYSIYSSLDDNAFEILVKVVPQGKVSPRLAQLKKGDKLFVQGPFGFFQIEEEKRDKSLLFCATGTGISPFHCFVSSYPNIKYTFLHGKRSCEEQFETDCFLSYVSCTSRDQSGNFSGRLTNYLENLDLDLHTLCYLCGNCDMIYDAYDILRNKGISSFNIFSEVYY